MGKVLLCVGKYAKNPYFVEKVYINVYSIEEFCYCMIQNIHMIDREIMDTRLIDWVSGECGLLELGEQLLERMSEEHTVSEFLGYILEYTGYGTEKEIDWVKDELTNGVGLSVYEKKKLRADYFAQSRKYVLALKLYDVLIEELPELEKSLKARVYHNRGVIHAELFQFLRAAESFRLAYECDGARESVLAFLAASRMGMEETEYLNLVAGQGMDYELSLQVEKLLENVKNDFAGTEESRMLFTLKVCKEEDNTVSYYEEIEHITGELKERYREIVAE